MKARVILSLKIFLTVIYAIGILCVAIFSVVYLQHSTVIPYPDAMLPTMKYEIAAWRLIIGFPFMLASCIFIVSIYDIEKKFKKILVYLPAIFCLVMCISYFLIG